MVIQAEYDQKKKVDILAENAVIVQAEYAQNMTCIQAEYGQNKTNVVIWAEKAAILQEKSVEEAVIWKNWEAVIWAEKVTIIQKKKEQKEAFI